MGAKTTSLLVSTLLLAQIAQAAAYPITIPYGRSWPLSIVIDSSGGLVYVDATSGEYPPAGFSLGVINASSHLVTKVLPLNVTPGAMAIDQRGGDVFVAGSDSIEVFGRGHSAGRILDVGHPIIDIAYDWRVSPNIFFTTGSNIFAVDSQTGKIVANASAQEGGALAIDPSSGRLFVAGYVVGMIAVFQASNLAVVGRIPLPSCCAVQLALDSTRGYLYASTGTNNIDVVNVKSGSFERSVQVAPSSQNRTGAIVADNETGWVFVSSSPGGSIVEIEGSNGRVAGHFKADFQVAGLAIHPKNGELYATNYHQVMVFNLERNRIPFLLIGAIAVAAVAALVGLFLVLRRRDAAERARIQSGWHRNEPGIVRST